jgi:drug/metabolite transporter (DMT)-like permease
MYPFLIALIPPVLYSISNLIDKNLLSRYFKEGGAGTLILFSSLFAGVMAPVFYFIEPSVTQVTLAEILILGIAALLDIILLWFFFAAIEKEEPSVVIAYYQLVPVIGLILG